MSFPLDPTTKHYTPNAEHQQQKKGDSTIYGRSRCLAQAQGHQESEEGDPWRETQIHLGY